MWHRWHKWAGVVCALFILLFALSGLVLNHRGLMSGCEVGRQWLPPRYAYKAWNGGLLRGTLRLADGRVLIYGANGLWLTDSLGRRVSDYNGGLPASADLRQVRHVVTARRATLYAATPFALYQREAGAKAWREVKLPAEAREEKLSDLAARGDTLVVLTRSRLYVSEGGGMNFRAIALPPAADSDGRVTLFRSVWMLHTGELFGTVGQAVVDLVALALIVLSMTGAACFLFPKFMQRHKGNVRRMGRALRVTGRLHNKLGRTTLVLTLLVAATGWMLRPPLMIPLVLTRTAPLPGSTLDSPNPWHDRLRLIRYDHRRDDWLLSTSEGFYALRELGAVPQRQSHTPPVSVMGLNVFESDAEGRWLCGSFSGLYVWDRGLGRSTDWFTGLPAPDRPGPPVGQRAISGYSADFATGPFAVDYSRGTSSLAQPDSLRHLPMSLWNVALELHSGRLYVGQWATYFYIFVIGAAILVCLWSGWKMRRRR